MITGSRTLEREDQRAGARRGPGSSGPEEESVGTADEDVEASAGRSHGELGSITDRAVDSHLAEDTAAAVGIVGYRTVADSNSGCASGANGQSDEEENCAHCVLGNLQG